MANIKTKSCIFCQIITGKEPGYPVYEDDISISILDSKPLFAGHVLVIPKQHIETLSDLPVDLIAPFFKNVKLLSMAVPAALKAQGSFVAINNIVSQSIPHLHVHIVPRTKGDGLKGFFWPRQRGINDDVLIKAQKAIIDTIQGIKQDSLPH
jgi:histidine triad (HIT) family protein